MAPSSLLGVEIDRTAVCFQLHDRGHVISGRAAFCNTTCAEVPEAAVVCKTSLPFASKFLFVTQKKKKSTQRMRICNQLFFFFFCERHSLLNCKRSTPLVFDGFVSATYIGSTHWWVAPPRLAQNLRQSSLPKNLILRLRNEQMVIRNRRK